MQSEYRMMHAETHNWIEFPDMPHDARLGVLLEGRPFSFGPALYPEIDGENKYTLIIHHEAGQRHAEMTLSDEDFAMSDQELKERRFIPCISNLDASIYPERLTRFIAASREYARQMKKAA